jgi:cyclin M-like protein
MKSLAFVANSVDAVGVPATNWDMPGIIFLKLLAVVFLVLLNGFFVASEFAIVKVRASQLDTLTDPGDGRLRPARHVTSHLDLAESGLNVVQNGPVSFQSPVGCRIDDSGGASATPFNRCARLRLTTVRFTFRRARHE